jgi:hypothetical protein
MMTIEERVALLRESIENFEKSGISTDGLDAMVRGVAIQSRKLPIIKNE